MTFYEYFCASFHGSRHLGVDFFMTFSADLNSLAQPVASSHQGRIFVCGFLYCSLQITNGTMRYVRGLSHWSLVMVTGGSLVDGLEAWSSIGSVGW